MLASKHGHADCVHLLLEEGAKVNVKTDVRETIFYLCICVLRLLICTAMYFVFKLHGFVCLIILMSVAFVFWPHISL